KCKVREATDTRPPGRRAGGATSAPAPGGALRRPAQALAAAGPLGVEPDFRPAFHRRPSAGCADAAGPGAAPMASFGSVAWLAGVGGAAGAVGRLPGARLE